MSDDKIREQYAQTPEELSAKVLRELNLMARNRLTHFSGMFIMQTETGPVTVSIQIDREGSPGRAEG